MIDLWGKEAYSSFIKPEKSPGGNFLSSIGMIWAQREMTAKSQKKEQTLGYTRLSAIFQSTSHDSSSIIIVNESTSLTSTNLFFYDNM